MSSTRHADPDAPISQGKFMSSPEYVELRGISGSAVAAKAALLDHPAKKALLFFIQGMSLKPGGLPKFCRAFLDAFTDRIGTRTLLAIDKRKGDVLPLEVALTIGREINCGMDASRRLEAQAERARAINALQNEREYIRQESRFDGSMEDRSFSSLLEQCKEKCESLADFLIKLCIDPSFRVSTPGGTGKDYTVSFPWFKDIIGALYEFKRRHEATVRAEFVMTEIGQLVFETLDAALDTGKMVLVEGNSGIGKTTATEAWCNLHLGEARFVSLSGITTKTVAFRAIAKALGLASGNTVTATQMQSRIEETLQRSRLLLVLDEAHFLFNGAERVYTRPELVDWVNTALYNHGVPCALVCTPQFKIRMAKVEKQTGWNGDQLKRRVKRFCVLPIKPRKEDLEAIARKLLPQTDRETVALVVGYALTRPLHLSALVDAVDEAVLLAKKEGRERVDFDDASRAIQEYCAPSSAAWSTTATAEPKRARKAAQADIAPLGSPAPGTRSKTNLTGLLPVETSPVRRRSAPLAQDRRGDAAEVLQ